MVSFATPEWIGDVEGDAPGKFGLWSSCYAAEEGGEECRGRLDDLLAVPRDASGAAAACVAAAALASLLAVVAMLLFLFCHSTTVFHVCAWLQLISGESFLFLGRLNRRGGVVLTDTRNKTVVVDISYCLSRSCIACSI